jgi:glycosyltransferase involved in cell wall biosynthesis
VSSSLRIVVTGLIAQHPRLGGLTWHYLQYVLGLARLGHEVYYFEDSGEVPYRLHDGATRDDLTAEDCTENVGCLARVMARFGLEDRWAYRYPSRAQWFGLSDERRDAILRSADLLINVSGSLAKPWRYRCIPRLAYIDTDPVVTQTKLALGKPLFVQRVEAHDVHFSYGERLTDAVPGTAYRWQPTRQPILLSEWESSEASDGAFTTVMNWTSYAPLRYAGRTYGQKDIEFKRFLELPEQVAPVRMEVALAPTQHEEWEAPGSNGSPRDLLARTGWQVVQASEACRDLDHYREFIRSSRAEWSVAKNAYVRGRPGWFSERSACYLASGRPVVVQDTGFGAVLPVGEGILTFETLEQAAAAVRDVDRDYGRHARAARAIAEEFFDSNKVLADLVERATASSPYTGDDARRLCG